MLDARPFHVLHLPSSYLPWTVGGKEVYTAALTEQLQEFGWQSAVGFHQTSTPGQAVGTYEHANTQVHVLPPLADRQQRSAIYSCATVAVPSFTDLLRSFRPQIVHFHDFSVSANLMHMRMAQAHGAKIVMTYHAPGQSCLQRSLRYQGITPCDGAIVTQRCTACRLTAAGSNALVSSALATLPLQGLSADRSGPLARALSARAMTLRFQAAWCEMARRIDAIQVLSDWSDALIRRNGVPDGKIHLIRGGVAGMGGVRTAQDNIDATRPLRLVFIGRCDPVKGVDVLIDAIGRIPKGLPIEISLFGPYWQSDYGHRLTKRIEGDRRFHAPQLIEPHQIVATLSGYDACVVPSLWLETGPLVVWEAFAAGIPIIGSRLGGIAEIVKDHVNGLLFEPGDAQALARIISHLTENPAQLAALKAGITKPRSMSDAARETAALYRRLIDQQDQMAAALPHPRVINGEKVAFHNG